VKTRKDPRHQKRVEIVQRLFAYGFSAKKRPSHPVVTSILAHRRKIDTLIAKAAPAWPLKKINRVDLAVLRLATWELVIEKKTPQKVVIDEAVELAKHFGAEGSPGFVNGVLGSLVKPRTVPPSGGTSAGVKSSLS
jgi:N utilization substance protein B